MADVYVVYYDAGLYGVTTVRHKATLIAQRVAKDKAEYYTQIEHFSDIMTVLLADYSEFNRREVVLANFVPENDITDNLDSVAFSPEDGELDIIRIEHISTNDVILDAPEFDEHNIAYCGCGHKAELHKEEEIDALCGYQAACYWVMCTNPHCNCTVGIYENEGAIFLCPEDAVTGWNRARGVGDVQYHE